jgi:hypothetical protein
MVDVSEVSRLIDDYMAWLRDKTTLRQVGDEWVEITTPHLDRHNDHMQVYIRREGAGFVLTDDGYTIQDLEQSGCGLDTPRRRELLRSVLAGFGVESTDEGLAVRVTPESFARGKHNLLQAMVAVDDLFYVAGPVVASLFHEDVLAWLDSNGVRYTQGIKLTGRAGVDHVFSFIVPRSAVQPERVIDAVNRPDQRSANMVAFKWSDVRETRPAGAKAYALLNDQDNAIAPGVERILRYYGVIPVPWGERASVAQDLAA